MKELYPELLEDWHPADIQLENVQIVGDPKGNDCAITIFTDNAQGSDFVPLFILTEINEDGECVFPGYLQTRNQNFTRILDIALNERPQPDSGRDNNDSSDFPA